MKTSQLAEAIEQETNRYMRSKLNLPGSTNQRVGDKLSMSRMPVELLDAGSWRLPSGQALAEFALRAGFVAPLLFKKTERGLGNSLSMNDTSLPHRSKHLGKGVGR